MTDKTTEELAQWLETTANNDADQEAWVSASKLRQAAARLRELKAESTRWENGCKSESKENNRLVRVIEELNDKLAEYEALGEETP